MKNTLKYVGIGLGALILIVVILGLILPGDYAVEREVSINKPSQEVFDYLVLLRNQDNFSKWASMDPDMKKTFRGTDGTVGFVSAWDSENEDVGRGEQEIMKITQGERIDYELRFFEPFEATDDAYMTTERNGNITTVKWGFKGAMAFPMNLMLPFMGMEEMLGADLQTGLDNLKKELEG